MIGGMFTKDNVLMWSKHIDNQKKGITVPISQDNDYVYGDLRHSCPKCRTRVKSWLMPREPIEQVIIKCPHCTEGTRVASLNIFLN